MNSKKCLAGKLGFQTGRYVKDRTLKDRLTTEQVPYTLKTGNDRIHT